MRIITLSNRGISFQFRLPMKSFFCNTQSARVICVSVLFTIQVTKHESAKCFGFLTIEYTYLYKKKKMKVRDFFPIEAYFQARHSQHSFSSLSESEIPALHAFSFSTKTSTIHAWQDQPRENWLPYAIKITSEGLPCVCMGS